MTNKNDFHAVIESFSASIIKDFAAIRGAPFVTVDDTRARHAGKGC